MCRSSHRPAVISRHGRHFIDGGPCCPSYDEHVSAVSRVSPAQAEEIARRHYGVHGSAERLSAEFDDAFRLVAADDSSWFVKICLADGAASAAGAVPAAVPGAAVSLQTAVLLHLAAAAPG